MLGLLAVAAFIAVNGFFVAAEFALVKLRAVRRAKPAAAVDDPVERAVQNLDRYLSVTQLGVTLASLGLGWVGEPSLERLVNQAAVGAIGRPLSHAGESVAVGAAFCLLTFGHVLLGELVPKLIAIQRADAIARAAVGPVRVIYAVMRPVLWSLEASSRGILTLFGMPLSAYREEDLSEDELVGMLGSQVARGANAAEKSELLRRMLRFSQRIAKQAMIPRVDVFSLPLLTKPARAVELLRTNQYSRVPLSRGADLDHVAGYLYWKDLLLSPPPPEVDSLEPLRRDVLFVAETQSLVNVLRAMQKAQTPFAVVVDEYGGASGILSMEDLLEEIVGEIRDEFDVEPSRLEARGDGVWEADGGVILDELVGATGLSVGDIDDPQTTVGGAVLSRLGRLPRLNDTVTLGSMRATVIGLSRRRLTRVRLESAGPPVAPSGRHVSA